MSDVRLPELLCPAGSEVSLRAAIEGGADAVYLGGTRMNARIYAGNFDSVALREAVRLAHAYGVKVYLTLNTLVTDRELNEYLDAALEASRAGVDALIVADLGGACMIHRVIPEMELHASTQMSGHNSLMGMELQRLGFSRMVAAREISEKNLRLLLQDSPIETELFVHGALCVSHSGQCLFSSLVGGRSGNRGECAQPCRLPYACGGTSKGKQGKENYPLSLKDLSLARHVPQLIEMGVASLKIEGRMKSPEYVYDTARIWRRLLDERRSATQDEMKHMADTFSRSGFTDGYFTGYINTSMLGVRRESDKRNSREIAKFEGLQKKVPLVVECSLTENVPSVLSLTARGVQVTVSGDVPQVARTAPMTEESVRRSICRFGGTPYDAVQCSVTVGEGLMLPVSRLNDLRRRGVETLEQAFSLPKRKELPVEEHLPKHVRKKLLSARFERVEQITKQAREYFDRIFLPLYRYESIADGVVLPPVIFDEKLSEIQSELRRAKDAGAVYAMVGNLGHLSLVKEVGMIPLGDFRLNATNRESVAQWEAFGVEEVLLSPELSLPQMRDVGGNTSAIVYGRIPLMTLEKCVSQELTDCKHCSSDSVSMVDRKGIAFPVLREWEHRSVVYNSHPTVMSDRDEVLRRYGICNRHFIFTNETAREVDAVVEAYRCGRPVEGNVRRM